jgi:hypothetical protein
MGFAHGHHAGHVGDVTPHVGQQEGLGSVLHDGRFKILEIDAEVGVHVDQDHLGTEVFDGTRHRGEREGVEQDHVPRFNSCRAHRKEHRRTTRIDGYREPGAEMLGEGPFEASHPCAFRHVLSVSEQPGAVQHSGCALHCGGRQGGHGGQRTFEPRPLHETPSAAHLIKPSGGREREASRIEVEWDEPCPSRCAPSDACSDSQESSVWQRGWSTGPS